MSAEPLIAGPQIVEPLIVEPLAAPDPSVAGDADLAGLAAVIAEPARASILLVLTDGRALPASTLAAEAGVAASTASGHLAKMVGAGLIRCRPQGRHRYYELAGPQVAELVEALARLAPPRRVRSLRQATQARALRDARTCYDHLAGRLGVSLFGALIADGDVTGGDGRHRRDEAVRDLISAHGHDLSYRLTASGHARLTELGARLPAADADGTLTLAYCVDWTEQHHHLGGAVGRAVTAALLAQEWLERAPRGRAVHLTGAGRRELRSRGLLGDSE